MIQQVYVIAILLFVKRSGAVCANVTALLGDPSAVMGPTQLMFRARRFHQVPTDADIATAHNAQRVSRLFPESSFNFMFPLANLGLGPGKGPYSYYNFLKAVTMFPSFCNEAAAPLNDNLDQVCLSELATIFAQFGQEVGYHDPNSQYPMWRQALYYYNQWGCDPPNAGCSYTGSTCNPGTYQEQAWPCSAGQEYFGRGAMQLTWNYNYGPFSQAIYNDVNVLLENPGLIVQNDTSYGWLSFGEAIWFYMTPQSPKPSMHDVVTGFWKPNAADVFAGRVNGFGMTIMILNGADECSQSSETQGAAYRIQFWQGVTTWFGIPSGSPSTQTCAKISAFDDNSAGHVYSAWDKDWSNNCACALVKYMTPWQIYNNPSDPSQPYNECVAHYFGNQCPCVHTVTTPTPTATLATTVAGTTTSNRLSTTTVRATGASSSIPPSSGGDCSTCTVCEPSAGSSATFNQCSICAQSFGTSWPCGNPGLCQCGSATATPIVPCSDSCLTGCVSIPNNQQGATDETCKPCGGPSGQTWWPCNVRGLCECNAGILTTIQPSSAASSTKSRTTTTIVPPTTTTKPVTTTTATTTTRSSTTLKPTASGSSTATQSSTNPCDACSVCEASLGSPATTAQCSICAQGLGQYWPCGVPGLCQCSATATAPPILPCGVSCKTTCVAIPNNQESATESLCKPCSGGPNPQTYWPCNRRGLCECLSDGSSPQIL